MDYSQTLQLPKTKFPMRANLPKREPDIQDFWEKNDVYAQLQEQAKAEGRPRFILHDGPPYANGHIHIGTGMNKVLKDIVIRSRTMDGYWAPYVPGWDTHGLPIEQQVIKNLKLDRHRMDILDFRRHCHEYALKFVDVQRNEFIRLGVWGDWSDPYLTLTPAYEAKQIEVFGQMAAKGYMYKGLKPVYWCADCETALAEAEIEYRDKDSSSIYVAFPVKDDQGLGLAGHQVLIWTTTPWTIPANMAIALHPDLEYTLLSTPKGNMLVAKELARHVAEELGLSDVTTTGSWQGRDLEGVVTRHPLVDRESPLILGDHVTLEQGTGCVHTAPGHGLEDYEVGVRYGLEVYAPVDSKGVFTAEAGRYEGMKLDPANKEIIADLEKSGHLLGVGAMTHQYPHCWRCKKPVVFRATEQWFASVEGFRQEALEAIRRVQWVPSWGIDRITNMVRERNDWCISRQRVWGVPIPIFYCEDCGEAIINEETIASIVAIFGREGSSAWFAHPAEELLPDGYRCPHCQGSRFSKEKDTMDVWFDSGTSHVAVLTQRNELAWPADLYLEGSDQHRGWFQSSLLTSVATLGEPPYKAVLTHGFIVDAEGKKMSKSLGNVIAPAEVINKYGADVFRLWAASADYRADVRVSEDILQQVSEAYRRIRNTCRFILGNLGDFQPEDIPLDKMPEVDRWALHRLQGLIERTTQAYREYDFHLVYHALHNFCSVDMSSFYLDVLKDRLYCDAPSSLSRRSAQQTIYQILRTLVLLMAPILVHTAEEVWQCLPEEELSVHLVQWPKPNLQFLDEELAERWDVLMDVRKEVARALEQSRVDKLIGSSNEGAVDVYANEDVRSSLRPLSEELAGLFIVSQAKLRPLSESPADALRSEKGHLAVKVTQAPGQKCPRCWRYYEEVVEETLCPRCTEALATR
ncbi:MAG: isoleucine--tRNA ligase [Limnochordia bacterium]|jgi:isoleucyl-tRNA synthetase